MTRASLRQLTAVFFRYGNWTFGGGTATAAVLHDELVVKRGLVDEETFSLSFGIARLTPGTNFLSFVTGVGWLLQGAAGAVTALLVSSIPCSLVALAATALYALWSGDRWVAQGLRGAAAAAVGLMVATGWLLLRPYLKTASPVRLILFALGALALGLWPVSPIWVLLAAAAVGFLWPPRERD